MIRFRNKKKIQTEEIIFTNLSFSEALKWLKDGKKVSRAGWDGNDKYIQLVKQDIKFGKGASEVLKLVANAGTIYLYSTVDPDYTMIWPCNQIDILMHDWYIIG